jgi:hypothetical protein
MNTKKTSKTPTTIKIAAENPSQRADGAADPGPGDPEAAPSEMPEPVSLPAAPTPSELVVKSYKTAKSIDSRVIKTINDPLSYRDSKKPTVSTAMAAQSNQETDDANDLAPPGASEDPSMVASGAGTRASKTPEDEAGAGSEKVTSKTALSTPSGLEKKTSKSALSSPSGLERRSSKAAMSGTSGLDRKISKTMMDDRATTSKSPVSDDGSGADDKDSTNVSDDETEAGRKKKKKMAKFRYHKRVTVRTHGKTSPSAVIDKVHKKDHKAGMTASSIGEMDTEDLIKKAGIKNAKKGKWRVHLRQTRRVTKGGKTVTETRVAYRDSEGNKRIKTSSTPDCQKCGKKLELCRCDE